MKHYAFIFATFYLLFSCKNDPKPQENKNVAKTNFVVAFGSCNNQVIENFMWKEITKNNPDVWVWGGDIIYSDTEDMKFMQDNYNIQKNDSTYSKFAKTTDILAIWDDHDYGLNDGGEEYSKKIEAQQLFLDFLDVDANDKRRTQEGIYFAKDYNIEDNVIKIILLDTRYFRTALTPDEKTSKRYKSNTYGNGTMLGNTQWKWLENQLNNSKANFNVIVSSIQFLSYEHGFESWGTMPHEIDKFENILKTSNAKNIIILSGDRHISEISKKTITGLSYPLIDFTSSGLSHSYTSFSGEDNKFRIVDVVSKESFGILKFDFDNGNVTMEIREKNNKLLRSFVQNYKIN